MPTIWVGRKPYKVSIVSPLIAREPTHEEWLSYNKERDAATELRSKASNKSATGDHRPWTALDDRLLLKLLKFRTPWNLIAAALGRPIEEPRRRWDFLRGTRPKQVKNDDGKDKIKPAKRVSFAEPLVTGGDMGKETGHDGLTSKDKALLHKIAEKWQRDRWFAISTRFNEKTGKHITAELAKSVIQGETRKSREYLVIRR